QPDRALDRLGALRARERRHDADRLRRGVLLGMIEGPGRLAVPLAGDRGHASTSTPMLRAVPAMILAAISTSLAFRSAIFFCAMSRSCAWVSDALLSRLGTPEPFSIPAGCLLLSAAGGC